METLLLTGGSGFVGRNIAPLLRRHYRVVSLGRSDVNDISADLRREVPVLPSGPDMVVHGAALAHPGADTRPEDFMEVNVGGTRHLCEALERYGVPHTLVFISSVAVYGCGDGSIPIDEHHRLGGTSPYAASKIAAEEFLHGWCRDHGVHLAILRPSALVGCGARGNVGRMMRGISRGYYVGIGAGSGFRSITHVGDLASVIPACARRDGTWNIVGENMRIRDMERMMADCFGRRFVPHVPAACARAVARIGDFLGRRFPIDSERYRMLTRSLMFSAALAADDLGWHPDPIAGRLR